jgi:hypothetical protein
MLRLVIWGGLFATGIWVGSEAHRIVMDDRCLDAGGQVGARGLCEGVRPDG